MTPVFRGSLIFITAAVAGITACEKVIDIDLNSTNPRIVVEGYITDQPGPYTVKLTRTANYFDVNEFDKVSGATVTISDDAGNSDVLAEQSPGVYETTAIQGVSGRTYTLTIDSEDDTYTASSLMSQPVMIDSLSFRFQEAFHYVQEGYYVSIYFTDVAEHLNYYLLRLYNNGEIPEEEMGGMGMNYLVFEDDFLEGESFEFEFFQYIMEPDDTIVVELVSMDQDGYDYYNTMNLTLEGSSGGGFSGTPQNPVTNMSGDALGYFGAFTVARDTVVIVE
ncbi:MAG: DUF4249 domain-containing protein [Bacteroidota bacterium]